MKPDVLYSIKILQNQTEKHAGEIKKLKDIEPEMTCDIMFTDEQIKEHHRTIDGLNYCISILSKEL